MGGNDIEKSVHYKTIRSFNFIKPKNLYQEIQNEELIILASKGNENAQAELDARTLAKATD